MVTYIDMCSFESCDWNKHVVRENHQHEIDTDRILSRNNTPDQEHDTMENKAVYQCPILETNSYIMKSRFGNLIAVASVVRKLKIKNYWSVGFVGSWQDEYLILNKQSNKCNKCNTRTLVYTCLHQEQRSSNFAVNVDSKSDICCKILYFWRIHNT